MTVAPGSPRQLLDWGAVLVPRLGALARAYLPGASLDARQREHLLVALAATLGCETLEHAHQGWAGLLGPAELTEDDDDLVAWATEVVRRGPVGVEMVAPEAVPDEIADMVLALVAHVAAAALTLQAAGLLGDRLRRRSVQEWPSLPGQLLSAAAGAVLAVPTTLAGAAFGALGRIVPTAPEVELQADPNLMAQLLAEVLPIWLGSPLGRTLVVALPVSLPVAVAAGASGATVWVGRGRVVVVDGLDDGAWVVFDGEVDALVRAGSKSLNRELRAGRLAH
ncbi:MAG: hypothetical protein ACR2MB_12400 [Acidimicrobiales bacterium]